MEIVDLSYSFDDYRKYDEIDMHIGYRVHGHLYFLSNRKPSILIHEDGRGKSMSDTIGLKGINAFEEKRSTKLDKVNRYISTKTKYNPFKQKEVRNMANKELKLVISMHQNTKYKLMSGAYKNFDENYSIMKEFLHKLP